MTAEVDGRLRARSEADRTRPADAGRAAGRGGGGVVRRRTVLVIGPTPPPYQGMAVFTEMLLRSPVLARAYDVVHLDTADRRGLENMGRFDARNVLLALRHAAALAALVVRRRPDVIYVEVAQNEWGYLRDAVFIAIGRAFGRRVVTHLHGSHFRAFYETARPPFRWVVRRTSRWLSGALVLGEGLRGLYRGLLPDDRVMVAPNGIADPFPEGAPTRAGRDDGPVTVAYLGALFRPKGFLELLRAAALLKDAVPRLRFVFAGAWVSEDERADAAAWVAREGLERVVAFPGVVSGEGKRTFLREADIFVFPGYQAEGLPLVVLEAMAAALPVVSTPVGAIPDAVRDGVTGLLVPPCDAAALAGAIRRLAEDAALRERMGRAGRERFLEEFTDGRCVERLVMALDRICEGIEGAGSA
ncbi:MAG TPA: glycosyltransferase family 4 protein [Longimicrobiales bacterium]